MKFKRAVRDSYVRLLRETLLTSKLNYEFDQLAINSHREIDEALFKKTLSYYWAKLHKFPNLLDPKGLNDRIQWCKLFDQSDEAVIVCDKMACKSWVADQVGRRYNADTVIFTDDFAEFRRQIERLDSSIFVKGNADSGSTKFVNPSRWNSIDMKLWFDGCVSYRYGDISGEWGYQHAQKGVIAEVPLTNAWATDYKFICADGEPRLCHVIFGRPNNVQQIMIDMSQSAIGTSIYAGYRDAPSFDRISAKIWDEMVEVCRALSGYFRLCRVDLYAVENRVYVGEITLWPQSGTYRGDGELELEPFIAFDC